MIQKLPLVDSSDLLLNKISGFDVEQVDSS